jgi:hypothetical protein
MTGHRRRGAIRLKAQSFDLMTGVLGCWTDDARARLIGVSAKSIDRARRGSCMLGHDFIAQTMLGLGARRDELATRNLVPCFDELFEVVEGVPAFEPVRPTRVGMHREQVIGMTFIDIRPVGEGNGEGGSGGED